MDNYAVQLTTGVYATAADNSAYNFGIGDFTAECWFQATATGMLFSRMTADAARLGLKLAIMPGGIFQLQTQDASNNYTIDTTQTSALDGKWHHVAAVREFARLQVYFDGQGLAAMPHQLPPSPFSVWVNVDVQAPLQVNATSNSSIIVNELRLWNLARKQREIVSTMGRRLKGDEAGLRGYWPCTAQTLADHSAVGNNLTAHGTVSWVTPCALSAGTEFILDGVDYFTKLKEMLLAVRHEVDPQAPPIMVAPTFENLVVEIGKYAPVRLVMWNKSAKTQAIELLAARLGRLASQLIGVKPVGFIMAALGLVKEQLVETRQNALTGSQVLAHARSVDSNVGVYQESYAVYDLPLTGDMPPSQHQKIAIFAIGGKKYALVAGVNLETRYWDEISHPFRNNQNYHSWHDTAVLLNETMARAVEVEFDRRWAKSGQVELLGDTYVKMAFWAIDADASFDHNWHPGQPVVLQGDPTAVVNAAAKVPVQVLVTNAETRPLCEVEDYLVARIGGAQQYMFFENFCFHGIKLVQALQQRLREANPPTVIIMVPHLYVTADELEQMESFLTRLAAMALALPLASAVTLPGGQTVQRSACSDWGYTFGTPELGRLEFGVFTYRPTGGATQYVPVSELQAVTLPGDCPLILCAPVNRLQNAIDNDQWRVTGTFDPNGRRIYVHSKLALFDDLHALVGSANFNNRSLENDGEMSVAIHDSAQVAAIRTTLFKHWGMDLGAAWTRQDWVQIMQSFVNNQQAYGVGVIPALIADMQSNWPLQYSAVAFMTDLERWA